MKKLTLWEIDLPDVIEKANSLKTDFFGYDPGTTHMGLAWTNRHDITVAQLEMERSKDAVERMEDLARVLDAISQSMQSTRVSGVHVIEGASFSDHFGQVEMAEARATIVWWVKHCDLGKPYIIPPISVRKKAFGHAKIKAQDYWESDIPNDALAALSCLYGAIEVREKSHAE